MAIIFFTVIFGLLLDSQSTQAEIYKWVDEKGTVHFTQDPATIPEKYFDRAQQRSTEEDLMTPEEKMKAQRHYDKELQERQQKGKMADEAKEQERQLEEKINQLKKGECKILSYSQFERNLGNRPTQVIGGGNVSGFVSPGGSFHGTVDRGTVIGGEPIVDTCVDIVIQNNNGFETKTIQSNNIIAVTKKGRKVSPQQGVFIRVDPGMTYRGTVCFGKHLSTIVEMELRGL